MQGGGKWRRSTARSRSGHADAARHGCVAALWKVTGGSPRRAGAAAGRGRRSTDRRRGFRPSRSCGSGCSRGAATRRRRARCSRSLPTVARSRGFEAETLNLLAAERFMLATLEEALRNAPRTIVAELQRPRQWCRSRGESVSGVRRRCRGVLLAAAPAVHARRGVAVLHAARAPSAAGRRRRPRARPAAETLSRGARGRGRPAHARPVPREGHRSLPRRDHTRRQAHRGAVPVAAHTGPARPRARRWKTISRCAIASRQDLRSPLPPQLVVQFRCEGSRAGSDLRRNC